MIKNFAMKHLEINVKILRWLACENANSKVVGERTPMPLHSGAVNSPLTEALQAGCAARADEEASVATCDEDCIL